MFIYTLRDIVAVICIVIGVSYLIGRQLIIIAAPYYQKLKNKINKLINQ